jgi:hypothetical protein
VDEGKHINLTLDVIDVEAYRGKCIDIIEIKDGDDSEAPFLGNRLWQKLVYKFKCRNVYRLKTKQ